MANQLYVFAMKQLPLSIGLAPGFAAPAFAMGVGDHGHFFDGAAMGFGSMMIIGPIFMLALIAAIVAVIIFVFRSLADGRDSGAQRPLGILEERFARGEIDRDEFEERRQALAK